MERATVLIMLTLFTLLAGMAIAAYQLWQAEEAKKHPSSPKPSDVTKSG